MLSTRIASAAMVVAAMAISGKTSATGSALRCDALAEVSNDLFIVDSAGAATRLTSDGEKKAGASISPDGQRAAFVQATANQSNQFVIATKGGERQTFVAKNGSGMEPHSSLMALRWVGPTTVSAMKHVGPVVAAFQFYQVPDSTNNLTDLLEIAPSVGGTSCALNAKTKVAACVTENQVTVGNRSVYVQNPFDGQDPFDGFDLAVGQVHDVASLENVSIAVRSLSRGVSIEVMRNHEPGSETTLQMGEFFSFPMDWGVTIGVSVSTIDAKAGTARLEVRKLAGDGLGLHQAIAWVPNGNKLVVLTRKDSGSSLQLMEPKGDSWSSSYSTGIDIDASPFELSFPTPSTMIARAETQSALYTFNQPLGAGAKPTLDRVLPATVSFQLSDSSLTGQAVSWTCHE